LDLELFGRKFGYLATVALKNKYFTEKASNVHINQSLEIHLNINDRGAEDLFGYVEDEKG
jgi:hypothetical protein